MPMDSDSPDDGTQQPPQQAYDPYAPIRALYTQVSGGKYTPTQQDVSQWGTNIDANYLRKIQGAIGSWWQQYQAAQPGPTPTVAAVPDYIAGGGNAGSGQTPPDVMNGLLTKPFDQTFQAPPMLQQGGPGGLTYLPPNMQQVTAPRAAPPPVFGMGNTNGQGGDYKKAFQDFLASQQYAKAGAR